LGLDQWLKNPQEHPSLKPGIKQGIWETRLQQRTSERFVTKRSWVPARLVPGVINPEDGQVFEIILE
jgi:hypothetical protein